MNLVQTILRMSYRMWLEQNLVTYRQRIAGAQSTDEMQVIRTEIWPDTADVAPLDHCRRLEIMKDYKTKYDLLVELENPYPWPNRAA